MSLTDDVIEQLLRGSGELANTERHEVTELMGAVLLSIDERAARDAFIDNIDHFAPVKTVSLGETMLRTTGRRLPHDWHRWLDPIVLDSVENFNEGAAWIDYLAQQLWVAATRDEEPIGESEIDSALEALTRIANAIDGTDERLTEHVKPAVALAPVNEEVAQAQAARLELAFRFVEADLLGAEQFASAALVSVAEALEQPFEPIAIDTPLSRHVERWGSRLARCADDASRERLREAAVNSGWISSPFKETLVLAGSMREGASQESSPYGEDEIVDLSKTHGTWFDEGLGIWIEGFKPIPASVGRAIAPLSADGLPEPVATALSQRFRDASPAERTDLALPALGELLERPPTKAFLKEIGIKEADSAAVMDLFATLYGRAGNNPQREVILEISEALGPLPDSVRKQLITEIVIPMAHQGKEALDIVIKYLDVCLPPPRGTLQNLRKTLRERAKGKQQKNKVDKALLDANLIRRSGLLGRGRKDIEE